MTTVILFNLFWAVKIKSQLLGLKSVFWKHPILLILGLKLYKQILFTHLKLWVAVARHNFKWVKVK